MRRLCLFAAVLLVVLASGGGAPGQGPSTVHVAEMKRLEFLVGRWQGDAWFSTPSGQKHGIVQSEIVESKLGGTLLLIEGTGRAKVPNGEGPVLFNALAVVSYDAETKRFGIRAHKADGKQVDAEMKLGDRTFEWGFDEPRLGRVRYTMKLTENGEWHEIGDASRDGATWTRFVEMTLKKIG